MTTSNATATGAAAKNEKGQEKLAEKRRAVRRGLGSLLPGPRAVPAVPAPRVTERTDSPRDSSAAPSAAGSAPSPSPLSSSSSVFVSSPSSTAIAAGRAGLPVAPSEGTAVPSALDELHAVGQGAD